MPHRLATARLDLVSGLDTVFYTLERGRFEAGPEPYRIEPWEGGPFRV